MSLGAFAMSVPSPEPVDDLDLFSEEVPAEGSWTLGPLTLQAKYPKVVRTLPADKLSEYLLKTLGTFRASTEGPPLSTLPEPIAKLPTTAQRWLLYAALLMGVNKQAVPEFGYLDALVWLAENVAESKPLAPRARGLDFELQVLGRAGWLSSAMLTLLKPLTAQEKLSLQPFYRIQDPSSEGSRQLERQALQGLKAALTKSLVDEAKYWQPPGDDTERTEQPIEELRRIADRIQREVWHGFAPYVASRRDGPHVDGLRYSSLLYDRTAAQPTKHQVLGYVVNRMNVVGGRGGPGKSILSKAGYDGSRESDRTALLDLTHEWLGDHPQHESLVVFLVRHTEATSHGKGQIGMVTEFPFHESQAARRWRVIQTLIHELGHVLIHPRLLAAMKQVEASQVISEGFVEVMMYDLFQRIIEAMSPELKDLFMTGITKPAAPQPVEVGYGDAGKAAYEIYSRVGRDRFFMAFFNGDISLVGL
jgi:hypothetical protein